MGVEDVLRRDQEASEALLVKFNSGANPYAYHFKALTTTGSVNGSDQCPTGKRPYRRHKDRQQPHNNTQDEEFGQEEGNEWECPEYPGLGYQ